ncbi:MAG: hypothetical protein NT066_00790, partial [Candidatus Omnitrophica bacterium]|nr:hypothetical protein [Candidatus Omnitrophota bacterium]
MEKKELPNIEGDFKLKPAGLSGKLSGFATKTFGIIKLILGVSLLPFVYSTAIAFLNELGFIEKSLQANFWSGVITVLIVYLFVWEPTIVYTKGQKLLEIIFSFFKPLVRIAPYLLPVYTIILFIVYELLSNIIKSRWLIEYTIFLFGFTIALHLVFSAKSVRGRKSDFLKANYIFGFSLIYIINLALLAFCLNLIFKEFSLVNFFNSSFSLARNIFYTVFQQLFLK